MFILRWVKIWMQGRYSCIHLVVRRTVVVLLRQSFPSSVGLKVGVLWFIVKQLLPFIQQLNTCLAVLNSFHIVLKRGCEISIEDLSCTNASEKRNIELSGIKVTVLMGQGASIYCLFAVWAPIVVQFSEDPNPLVKDTLECSGQTFLNDWVVAQYPIFREPGLNQFGILIKSTIVILVNSWTESDTWRALVALVQVTPQSIVCCPKTSPPVWLTHWIPTEGHPMSGKATPPDWEIRPPTLV